MNNALYAVNGPPTNQISTYIALGLILKYTVSLVEDYSPNRTVWKTIGGHPHIWKKTKSVLIQNAIQPSLARQPLLHILKPELAHLVSI